MRKDSEKGLLSLEACISVIIFLFLMLFLYSIFTIFEARNAIAHAMLATSDSLAFDTYESSVIGESGDISQLISDVFHLSSGSGDGFTSSEKWSKVLADDVNVDIWDGSIYVDSDTNSFQPDDYGNSPVTSSVLGPVVSDRFFAYLSGGDPATTEKLLKRYHIKGGSNGISFAGTHIKSGKLYLNVKYTLEYEFNPFGLGEIQFEQAVCSKLWK